MRRLALSLALLLFSLLAWGQTSPPPPTEWQAGVHYRIIEPAEPTQSTSGRIEVLEFFNYKCPACNRFEPYLARWKRERDSRIEFTAVPVGWKADWQSYSRFHYAIKALGRTDLHQEIFDTVHQRGNPLATKDPEESFQLQLAFATAHDIRAEDFTKSYRSAGVEGDLERAGQALARYKITVVPSIVVAGKYLTSYDMAGSPEQLIALAEHLLALEHDRGH